MYTKRIEHKNPEANIKALQDLNRTGRTIFAKTSLEYKTLMGAPPRLAGEPGIDIENPDHCTSLIPKGTLPVLLSPRSFLEYAFRYPYYAYVEHELKLGYKVDTSVGSTSLLHSATCAGDYKMMQILLRYGADPNYHSEIDPTCSNSWEQHIELSLLRNSWKVGGSNELDREAKTIALFLEYKADTRAVVQGQSVKSIIYRFKDWDKGRTAELLEKFDVARKAQARPNRLSIMFANLGRTNSRTK
ncbi:uncharacterized protein LY89DRAFT_737743 [Mollisia scopiformis]|uniref:Uncharacterized protein n=1 Tax=Mollisia scopiformis TaxID=149040 RepID=A0A194WZ16_MOLSC|nr:uncharacterized protein LY89DRAFT_737743 [Mollisia scopiformis]KUJ12837.1 hypothetical protein LY89DRAFT_737743 [Mollisia scopiformis]